MIVVVPPQAAAAVPLAKSSDEKVPPNGISMCVWTSIAPGITSRPVASTTRSALAARPVPTAATFSPSTSTSARIVSAAVTTVPPWMRVRTPCTSCRVVGAASGALRLPDRGADGLDRLADVLLGHGQRGRDPQGVGVEAALADEQATLPAALHHLGRRLHVGLLRVVVGHQLDADHEALAAHLPD